MPHSVIEKPTERSVAAYDVEALRRDFPILNREVHGKPLVYLDNAATSQTPVLQQQHLVGLKLGKKKALCPFLKKVIVPQLPEITSCNLCIFFRQSAF